MTTQPSEQAVDWALQARRRVLRLCLTFSAAVVAGLAGPKARRAAAAGAPVTVDAAIVLAADVSRSIDDEEFALQRQGYADAIQGQQLIDAISTGPHGAIALAYVEWAGDGEERLVIDWAVIRNQADARGFVAAMMARRAPISGGPRSARRSISPLRSLLRPLLRPAGG